MTETMLTRMARAIAEEDGQVDPEPYIPAAKAALEAIYEPSEAMLEVASRNGPDTNNGPFSYDDARTVWRDMTASILQGEA